MEKTKTFKDFISEASVEGNIGIPGEEGEGRPSWLDQTRRENAEKVSSFSRERGRDIQQFGSMIQQSIQLQRGHEAELSELTIAAFQELYGALLDGVTLDLKIDDGQGIKQVLEEAEESETPDIEDIEDEEVKNQIHKRKILRSIQQGKGINSKAILNLSIFKDGVVEILGEQNGEKYIELLNKISSIAQWFMLNQSDDALKSMIKYGNASGACKIEIEEDKKEKEDDEDLAMKVLSDLEEGSDLTDSENAEELLSDLTVKVIARGIDLSMLIHETIKGIYMLVVQASIQTLNQEIGQQIVMNTETLNDEIEEWKYGPKMQETFFKLVAKHPMVVEAIDQMLSDNASDVEIASFQESLNFLFFSNISQLGITNAKEMLDLVNEILMESPRAEDMCEPLIAQALKHLRDFRQYRASQTEPAPSEFEAPEPTPTTNMSKDELTDAILDAYDKGDMAEVERLRKMLGEGFRFPRLTTNSLLEKNR